MTRRHLISSLALLFILCAAGPTSAKVFYSREGAFKLAFPHADKIERRHVYLEPHQQAAVEKLCRCRQKDKLLTVYEGQLKGKTVGFAYIDTHVVRTLPETFMVVIDSAGKVRGVHILAFHEPPEYMPRPRWLARFAGRRAAARLPSDVVGIAGATLSAHAITRATSRILAVHRVLGLTPVVAADARRQGVR